jgi:hypothetical protein
MKNQTEIGKETATAPSQTSIFRIARQILSRLWFWWNYDIADPHHVSMREW